MIGAKHGTEASDCHTAFGRYTVVGERSVVLRRQTEKTAGGTGSDYAGISSDKNGENPFRRKPKVSWGRFVRPGLVDP